MISNYMNARVCSIVNLMAYEQQKHNKIQHESGKQKWHNN